MTTCANCRYWHGISHTVVDLPVVISDKGVDAMLWGECRRDPPPVFRSGSATRWSWPLVDSEKSCGEFKARERDR